MSDSNSCIWVTGAGKGIGRAVALRLAGMGEAVAVSARTSEDLENLEKESASMPGQITGFPLDVTDDKSVEAVIEEIEARIGPISKALLNAGTHMPTKASTLEIEPFRKLMDTNFLGVVNCLVPTIARMRRRGGGRVAIVASLAGYRGLPSAAAYGASKAALINMAEALRPELADLGITLQLINPGFVKTPLTDRNEFKMPFLISADEAARRICQAIESGRFETCFPRRFALIMKLLRLLPDRAFFAVTRHLVTQ